MIRPHLLIRVFGVAAKYATPKGLSKGLSKGPNRQRLSAVLISAVSDDLVEIPRTAQH